MNSKWYLLIASAILFFSCQRAFVSSSLNKSTLPPASAQASAEEAQPSIFLYEQQYTENISGGKQKDTVDRKKASKKVKNSNKALAKETDPTQEKQDKLDKKQKTKKKTKKKN